MDYKKIMENMSSVSEELKKAMEIEGGDISLLMMAAHSIGAAVDYLKAFIAVKGRHTERVPKLKRAPKFKIPDHMMEETKNWKLTITDDHGNKKEMSLYELINELLGTKLL